MTAIKSKNTKPELIIRKLLFSKGYRFKIHDKKLPGKPDIVLPKHKIVINVHGCYWHYHRLRKKQYSQNSHSVLDRKTRRKIRKEIS